MKELEERKKLCILVSEVYILGFRGLHIPSATKPPPYSRQKKKENKQTN